MLSDGNWFPSDWPKEDCYDFLVYCVRNSKPCPVIEVTDPGDPEPGISAPGADLRTDLPKYAVYREVALASKPRLMITHAPAHSFVTDLRADQICIP